MEPRDQLKIIAADIWSVLLNLSKNEGVRRRVFISGFAQHVFYGHRPSDSIDDLTPDEIEDRIPYAETVLVILKTLRAIEAHR